ncbi:unnamed protein product [Protopolystoma xenopodis]|uniref:Uncharacterized protein n=1 Tax=Protopolystoma xenopodis TaxID=117903 RepID=A0A3S4ZVG0_9PLAT|nr:unnamed protein product [Protopolystoma xenopodis]
MDILFLCYWCLVVTCISHQQLSREEVRRVTSNANEYEAEQSAAPGGRGSLSSGRGRSSGRVLVGAPWSRSSGFADSTLDLDGDRGRGRGRGRGRAAGPSWPNSSIELSRDLAPAKITNGISLENSAAADADVDCQLNIPMTTRATGAWSQRISHKNSPVIIGGKDDNGSTDNEVAVLAGKVDNTDVYAVDHNPCSAVHSGIGLKQAT